MDGTGNAHGEQKDSYNIFIGEPESKGLRSRLQNNIKIDLTEVGCEGVDWI
jgi:hypothetical protein